MVIEHLEIGTVEIARHPAFGDGYTNTGGHALAEGAGGGLDPRGPAVFGVTRTFTVELAKAFDIVELHRKFTESLILRVDGLHPSEMQHRIQQHRGVTDRQNEAVTIGPDRIIRVKTEKPLPQ